MVDFDEPLGRGHATASPIPDQVAVMSKITELSRGRLLTLAPYCPLKDAAHQGASLKSVSDAWTKPGFVGAKMYPPMGFSPFRLLRNTDMLRGTHRFVSGGLCW